MYNISNGRKFNDKQLIIEYRKGEVEAFNLLFDKYQFHLKKVTNEYCNSVNMSYLTKDDIYSVCLESFFIGTKTYDTTCSNSFYSYWKKIVEHEMGKLLKEHSSFYKNLAFSFDDKLYFEDGLTIGELFNPISKDTSNYDGSLIMRICEDDNIKLSDEEKVALSLRMFGETFITISQKLNCDIRRARTIFHAAIRKIRKHKENFEVYK